MIDPADTPANLVAEQRVVVPPPRVPPTVAGALGEGWYRLAVWPTVLGVIAVIFGIAGVLQSALSAIAPKISSAFSGMSAGTVDAEVFNAQAKWAGWSIGMGAVGFIVAAMLLAGGVLLIRRRPRSVGVLKLWAIAKLVFMVGMSALTWRVQSDTFAAINPHSTAGPSVAFIKPFLFVGLAFNVVWLSALPVFMLLWLRSRHAQREIERWGQLPE